MQLSILAIALASLSCVQAQSISAAKTVSNIDGLTSMSQSLDKTAKTVTLVNGFQTGPEVIKGFHAFVKQATKDYNQMTGDSSKRDEIPGEYIGSPAAHANEARASTYTTAEQEKVCSAFKSFVTAENALLATVIGKHGILEATGVAYQMAAVLRGVEGVIDEIGFTLINEVPSCATPTKEQKQSVDKSLTKAIDTYANGLP